MPPDAGATEPMLAQAARDYRVTLQSQAVRLLCKVVSVLALARLVAPAEHGLYAMAGALVGALMLFRDLGLSTALVQAPQLTDAQCSALGRLLPLVGLALAAVTVALIPAAVWFFAEPRLAGLLLFLSLTFVLLGLGGLPRALLARQLRFAEINRLETTAAVLGTVAMIAAGALDAGAYAFGVFMVVVEAFTAAAAWRVCRWRATASADWAGLRPLFRSGTELTGGNLLAYALAQLDALLVGRWFGAGLLGPYARAGQLLTLPSLHIATPLANVTFATLSRLGSGSPGFAPHLRQCANQIAHLILPAAAACLVLPHEIVRLVLGPDWGVAAPMLRWLAASAVFLTLAAGAQPLCLALGRTGRLLALHLVSVPVIAAGLWFGRSHGPAGMAAGLAAANALLLAPRLLWSAHGSPVRPADFLRALAGPVALSTFFAVGANLTARLLPDSGWLLRLLASLAGGAVLASALLLVWPTLRRELRAFFARPAA